MPDKKNIADWFRSLQISISESLEQADGSGKFKEDPWDRPGGGGGKTRVLQNGGIIEKGGVNFSEVYGEAPDFLRRQLKDGPEGEGPVSFFASGVSIVIHPESPMIPIIHMNVRYFEMGEEFHWFGGGIDLTPHYVEEKDAVFFHKALKSTCDRFHPDYYAEFSEWADNYFFLQHRNETRGVGGIFFDKLMPSDSISSDDRWAFVKAVGETFVPVYLELIRRNKDLKYGERERKWQRIRRGRYAEFNLVYDRGTRFGLKTNGRAESILMSLPPQADWEYQFIPEDGSPEQRTSQMLRKGMDWTSR